jgi:hypothetical protein
MSDSDFDSEDLQVALGEALRAGPDSPAWKRVEEILAQSNNGVDVRSVLRIRGLLETAKDRYRVVRPSADFKEKMLAALAAEEKAAASSKSHRPVVTLVLAAMAACLAVGVLVGVVKSMFKTGIVGFQQVSMVIPIKPKAPAQRSVAEPVMFSQDLPPGWRSMGQLRLSLEKGMHLDRHDAKRIGAFTGAYLSNPLPADKRFDVEVVVRTVGTAGGSPEIFMTDTPGYGANPSADNVHEVVWSVTNDRPTLCLADAQVVQRGAVAPTNTEIRYDVKFAVDGETLTADVAGENNWHYSGPHRLDTAKPWWLGARLRVIGSHRNECAIVDSITVTPH